MREAILPVYAPPVVEFSYGKGMELFDTNGDAYLDFYAGIAVNALGHSHPALVETLKQQAGGLWHLSNMFRIPPAELLAERLARKTFADLVFFANSGAEANECGLKMMRRYHYDNGHPERQRIVAMHHSFHGRTIGTIAAAGNPDYVKGFIPDDLGFDHIEFGNIDALKAIITDKTAGVILEPVQGEGGICVAKKDYLQAVRELCDKHGILLMFDEVQCGVARSGALYAYEKLGVIPDILSTAKGIGGGFPLAACLATHKAGDCMQVGTHGSTFGGNFLATAVGNTVLDIVSEETFLAHVNEMSEYLFAQLHELATALPNVFGEISGLGLMVGIKVIPENTRFVAKLRDEERVLVAKAGGNSLRFLPPLIVEKEHIDRLITALAKVGRELAE